MLSTVLILMLLAVVGGALAFDVKGASSRLREQAHDSNPLRREDAFRRKNTEPYVNLNMAKVVGWIFFVVGAGGLLVTLLADIVSFLNGS